MTSDSALTCLFTSSSMSIKAVAMDNHLQLQLIVLLLLVTVYASEAKKREISYNLLEEGQKIFGKIEAEFCTKLARNVPSGKKSASKIYFCHL